MNDSWQTTLAKFAKPFGYAAVSAVALLALFLLVKTADAVFYGIGRSDAYPTATITVDGTGKATAIPDIAAVNYTVTEKGVTVGEAQTKATEKMNATLEFLKGFGVDEKDIKTTGYNVYPEYEYQPACYSTYCPPVGSPRIVGYQVSQSVEVKVRDTEKVGEVLQGLGDKGVQNIYGPNFTVDDPDGAKSEARKEAIEKAQAKAKLLAKQLGVRLGKVVSFYENTGGYPYYGEGMGAGGAMDVAMTKEAPAPNLPAGEQETQVTISITYEIK